MTHFLSLRNSYAFLGVFYNLFRLASDFLKLPIAYFRYTWSLYAFSSVVVPLDIAIPKDHKVLYFQKSYTLSFLVLPAL